MNKIEVGNIVKIKSNYSYYFDHHYKVISIKSISQLKREDLQLISAGRAPKYRLLIRNLQQDFTGINGECLGYHDNELVTEIEHTITKSRLFVPAKTLNVVSDADFRAWKKRQEERSKSFKFPEQPRHQSNYEQLSFGLTDPEED